ncbi:hypothetical protein OAL55_02865 [Verrucomicrobiales bacterium]|nr:hypothetical protein [Verrucomicrobiales bacterium]
MKPETAQRILVFMLRMMGVLSVAAVAAIFMPHAWMNWFHETMGMGELPDLPVVSYLSRSLSGFYLFFGAVVLYLARDVIRYLELIRFWARFGLVFATVSLYIDVTAKLPIWWIISEVGFLFTFFLYVSFLLKKIERARP